VKLHFEGKARKKGYQYIIGVDEAGRGPLAGPVVAAAVILKTTRFQSKIDDSKKLNAEERETAFHEIVQNAFYGVGIVSESVIDSVNILQATYYAMSKAVYQLINRLPFSIKQEENFTKKTFILVDGMSFKTDLPYAYEAIINGDARCLSIASASIVAKVTRDRILKTYDQIFPQYGFKQHKGYPTLEHHLAIQKYGPCLIHRKTFNFSHDVTED